MSDRAALFIPCTPVAAVRPKVTRWSTYYPGAYGTFLPWLRSELAATWKAPIFNVPVVVRLGFLMPRPASHYRAGRFSHLLKDTAPAIPHQDTDNLEKGALDALSGVAYVDDALVADQPTSKRYAGRGDGPGILVQVERANLMVDPFACLDMSILR